ncbi:MAG TPA: sigma-70 family RNA polymerase sigma factor [Longimicrobiales bacterium]|nr:sigma-70 family RNA polymerase sigma factor [Longimicrobiales bacterium]
MIEAAITEDPCPEPPIDFDTLIGAVLDRAYQAAVHMTRNQADAEDLVQDAVLRAWRGFDGFEPGTNFKAWFFRIMTNCFRTNLRKRRVEDDATDYEEVAELYLYRRSREIGLDVSRYDPASGALARLDAEQIGHALESLPEDYRLVATLYFVDEFRYEDIAGILDIPIGTVRSRLHRARRLLQKRLWQLAEEYGLGVKGESN